MESPKYISANPGQTINLFVQKNDADGYIPVVKNIFNQNMNALPGFPVSMTPFPDGYFSFYYPFTIPSGNAGLGTYTAEVLSQDFSNQTQYYFIINSIIPFGISAVIGG
jgi:hypothetical protein